MLAYLEVVCSDSVPHPSHPVLLNVLCSTFRALYLTVSNGVEETALLLLSVVQTEGRTYHEVLERSDADVSIAEGTPRGVLVVLVAVDDAQRILALEVRAEGLCKLTILSEDGVVRVKLEGALDDATRSIVALGAAQGEVLANDNSAVEQLIVCVGTC